MAAKRSPILGYNHNVRYRGVIFHVQTEDSGLTNPHVFTHLFHGGVILSTRKLVYDPDASEEAVKSLMQSQHKATLRDLKAGTFDDKIDQYLGGTPGLMPRGTEDNGVSTRAETHDDVSISRAPTESAKTPPAAVAPMPAIPTRTTQPRGGSSMTPPPVVSRTIAAETEPSEKREVSQAFKAMQMPDDLDIAEVHSPAPPSAAVPPGAQPERPGEYSQHKRRESGPVPPIARPRSDSAPPPRTDPAGAAASGPLVGVAAAPKNATAIAPPLPQRPGDVVRARPPTPGPRAPTVPGPPQPQRFPGMAQPGQTPVPRTVTPPAVSRSSTPAVVPRTPTPGQATRQRAPSGGGVVMSKPAVIVGAPPKVIGGSGSGATQAPAAQAAPPARAQPSGRVRKAREESEGGMFGQDLISEKSLDEVILAYLSEDGTEE